jgi:RHS repeat-associated protein
MFSRIPNSVWRHRRMAGTALVAVAALVVGGYLAVITVAGRLGPPAARAGAAVPVHVVRGRRVKVPAMRAWHRPRVSWPAAGTAMVAVKAPAGGRAARPVGAAPAAGSVRAGSLPVWVGPSAGAATTATAAVRGGLAAGGASAGVASHVLVRVSSQRTARALGVRGVVVSLAQAGRGAGRVHVSVSYAGFAQAFGGDYGARLRLVELPACALTRPTVAACRRQRPVGSANNARQDWVGADVSLPGAVTASAAGSGATRGVALTAAVAGQAVVLAVVAGPSGSAGDFAAEPLSEATNDWVSGPSSGANTYSYPVSVPPVPGGLAPVVALDYDSQATSGLTSSTNNEASWIGDGWSYSPGFIEADYTTCSQQALEPDTGDLCPGQGQVAMTLNGVTSPLVDGASGWRAEADGGATVKRSGTSWEVIEPDGVQYWFGLNQLPGYAAGDAVTNSVWTVPVWEGCGQAAFCTVPWRYNLDYVVDPHSDAMAYFYTAQGNYYAEQDGTTGTGAYTQGGALAKIEYGLRAGQVYTSTPAAQVLFSTTSTRQDAPTDLACAQGAPCTVTSPSFWADDELTGITTQALAGGSLQNVDSWALNGSYPATGDPATSPSLWLASITRTGEDGSTPVTLPTTTFAGTPLPNRVQTPADTTAGYSPLTRFYLSSITSDTGEVTTIAYTAPDPAPCAAGTFPAPSANTAACYPDYWIPAGATAPVQDWFNQYSVTSTTQADTTGGDPSVVTSYAYSNPGWHYDNDTISRSAQPTWDVWHGFQHVTTQTGTAPDPVTQTSSTFLQGMSQDGPASDPGPTVQVTTTRAQVVTDSGQFAGMLLEQIVYDGAGTGQQVTDTINLPWSSTATAVNTSLDQAAYLTGTNSTETYTALAGGGTQESTQDYTYNSYGLQASDSNVPDTSNTSESTCTTTTYAANTATGLLDLPATVITDAGACNASGEGAGALVSETGNFYDGGGLGAAPAAGNLTKTENATAAGVLDSTTYTYDEYGRVLTTTNPDNDTTITAYTPATGAEPTSVQVTDPMGLVTTTTYDPARELPLTVTDPDGAATTTTYDALGRQAAQWAPGNPATGPATTTYRYTVSNTAPWVTTEQDLEPGGNYLTTDTIDDSFGNAVEVQAETASGGTDVTDTTYNSDGWKVLDAGPYYVSGPPSGTLVEASASSVPDETGYDYDGTGRVVRQISSDDGTETWETDTSYGGDYTTVTPPAGGTPETTWTNGAGETTAIWQYHAGVPVSVSDPASDYDATTYTYTPGQKLATITDAAGNTWSYTYDLLGDQLTQTSPDSGKTTTTYDSAQRVASVTDARGKTISYNYDADGRKTATYDTTGGAAESSADELASWTYDTLAKGQLTSSTAYENGSAYTEQVTGYAPNGQPSGAETIIPSAQGALAGTYTQTYTYAPTGQETSYTDSAAGGLPAETVALGYNTAGEQDSLTGASPYVDSLSYTNLNQPLQYTLGTSSEPVYITDSYNPQTSNLTQQDTQAGTSETSVDDLTYSYNDVSDITSEADTPSGDSAATEVQCFQYDYLGRLVQAWAQGLTGCATTPSAGTEGGAAPYWETYAYSPTGSLTGVTSTTPAGATTTVANTYPGAGTAQPHAVTTQSVTTASGTTTSSYAYNTDGDLTSLTGGSQKQTFAWNDAGQLTQDAVTPTGATTAQDTNYTYDANGNLLVTADPGSTTLYLSDEELTSSGGTVTGTRYYTLGATTIAARTSASGVAYLIGDQQNTSTLAISASSLALTHRYYDPYGNPLGTVTSFPTGEKGFVGGAADTATGLTNLGIRQYQPDTASFISTDPILTPYTPQDLNPYAYATDDPATKADPTGAMTKPSGSADPCSADRLGSKAWLACEGLKHPSSMSFADTSTSIANLERTFYKACMAQPEMGPGDSADETYCTQQADNWAHELNIKYSGKVKAGAGKGCKASAIVSYATAGGSLVGSGEAGVALTGIVEDGIFDAAAVAVGSILGGVFAIGLAVVIVLSC